MNKWIINIITNHKYIQKPTSLDFIKSYLFATAWKRFTGILEVLAELFSVIDKVFILAGEIPLRESKVLDVFLILDTSGRLELSFKKVCDLNIALFLFFQRDASAYSS